MALPLLLLLPLCTTLYLFQPAGLLLPLFATTLLIVSLFCPLPFSSDGQTTSRPAQCNHPDFAAPDFAAQCQFLTDGGIQDAQAVNILANIWNANNARECAAWLQRQAEQEQAQHEAELAAEEEAQRCRQEEADLLKTACIEDHKKNKAKYNPI